MAAAILSVLFFCATFVLAVLVLWLSARVMDRAGQSDAAAVGRDSDSAQALFKEDEVSSISLLANVLERFDFVKVVQLRTAEAGLDWSAGRLSAMALLCTAMAWAALSNFRWLPSGVALILSLLAGMAPYIYVLRVRKRRFAKFEAQFPDALESLCRALKAGHPFSAAMEALASEAAEPIGGELRKTIDQWKLGFTWQQALDGLSQRVPATDVAIFTAAVKLHMRTGGRLGDVLTKLAESMRESGAIKGEVRSVAAHGRLTGRVLTVLPIGIAAVMFNVNPDQMLVLVSHPIGKVLIIGAAVLLVLAHIVIQKIVDIEI